MSNCYESIQQKVDQTYRRHIFNVENPPRRRGKSRASASNNLTIFRVVTDHTILTMIYLSPADYKCIIEVKS
jgi:hypothetical protein